MNELANFEWQFILNSHILISNYVDCRLKLIRTPSTHRTINYWMNSRPKIVCYSKFDFVFRLVSTSFLNHQNGRSWRKSIEPDSAKIGKRQWRVEGETCDFETISFRSIFIVRQIRDQVRFVDRRAHGQTDRLFESQRFRRRLPSRPETVPQFHWMHHQEFLQSAQPVVWTAQRWHSGPHIQV